MGEGTVYPLATDFKDHTMAWGGNTDDDFVFFVGIAKQTLHYYRKGQLLVCQILNPRLVEAFTLCI